MKKYAIIYGICTLLLLLVTPAFSSTKEPPAQIPVPGMVTMVDLGADKCIPCKMMAPILVKLAKDYEGRAAIIFIDVWKDKTQGQKFKVRAIPTQVFFDQNGREIFRHQGFMGEKDIIRQLEKMGVTPANQGQ